LVTLKPSINATYTAGNGARGGCALAGRPTASGDAAKNHGLSAGSPECVTLRLV
jgi:hypothetical protein